jgi:osmotically-inducible protein OsmY
LEVSDDSIEHNVKDTFRYDPRVSPYDITVEVRNGRVWLSGIVEDLQAKKAAGRDAALTTGVWKVENEIRVRPKDAIADKDIAQNIRRALRRNPFVERFDVGVTVRNRYAFLTGDVDSRYEKMEAEEVASRVKGVAGVQNYITFREDWQWKRDSEIKGDVESELMWSPFVDGDQLTVRVDQGNVELAGKVGTWHEYLDAVENAFEGGAKTVRSYLRVEQYGRVFDEYWSEPPEEAWIF